MEKLLGMILEEYEASLRKEPFHFLDLGCSGGVSVKWRMLEPFIRIVGIDPDEEEIRKLSLTEKSQNIRYECGNLELHQEHPIRRQRGRPFICESHKQFRKTSAWDACSRNNRSRPAAVKTESENHIDLPVLLKKEGFQWLDFIKIDIDGPDFDALLSLEGALPDLHVLGFQHEVNFNGSTHPHDHTFHNTDRFMRKFGFELYDLDVRRYSKAKFPAKFLYSFFGQTESGALAQGDALYFRTQDERHLVPIKKVKLIILMMLYGHLDSAIYLANDMPEQKFWSKVCDEAAKKSGFGSYMQMLEKWDKHPESFFPG